MKSNYTHFSYLNGWFKLILSRVVGSYKGSDFNGGKGNKEEKLNCPGIEPKLSLKRDPSLPLNQIEP